MGATDDDVTHEIAMALTKASQRSGSPQVYRMASRKQETASPSQLQDGGRMVTLDLTLLLYSFTK